MLFPRPHSEGEVRDLLAQRRRGKTAAVNFLRELL
jgi:hypothetical protein